MLKCAQGQTWKNWKAFSLPQLGRWSHASFRQITEQCVGLLDSHFHDPVGLTLPKPCGSHTFTALWVSYSHGPVGLALSRPCGSHTLTALWVLLSRPCGSHTLMALWVSHSHGPMGLTLSWPCGSHSHSSVGFALMALRAGSHTPLVGLTLSWPCGPRTLTVLWVSHSWPQLWAGSRTPLWVSHSHGPVGLALSWPHKITYKMETASSFFPLSVLRSIIVYSFLKWPMWSAGGSKPRANSASTGNDKQGVKLASKCHKW